MVGVVDVGGGTRGIYGAGVFDYCIDQNICFDYVIGASSGSANILSYLARQKGRNYKFYQDYIARKESMSLSNLFHTGSFLNLDYLFGSLIHSHGEDPVDYETFAKNQTQMEVVVTDATCGDAVYFDKTSIKKDDYRILMASCAVPSATHPYRIANHAYYDGGISDPIPFRRAIEAGCDHLVVVLTRPRGFFRKGHRDKLCSDLILRRKYPEVAKSLTKRSRNYNQSLEELYELEKSGKVLIVSPNNIEGLGTLTRDPYKLDQLYKKGYEDAKAIKEFLARDCRESVG